MRLVYLAVLSMTVAHVSWAQARHETIRGLVTDGAGVPLPGVLVSATMAPNREVFQRNTDSTGRYVLQIPRGTGDYLVSVTKIGLTPFRRRLTRASDDSVFTLDVKLAPIAQQLTAVRVQATKPVPSRTPDPGTSVGAAEKVADQVTGSLLPDEMGDLSAIAATVPGVTPTSGGLSVLGLGPNQNSVTLDGMAFGGTSLPRGLPVNVRVSTTAYDPARGWFAGANTNAEIRGGSIYSFRQAFATLDVPQLQYADPVSNRLGQRYGRLNASVGGSGPIDSFDRYFYSFGLQGSRKSSDGNSLLTSDPVLLRHAGIAPDSVTRFANVLESLGIPSGEHTAPSSVLSDNVSFVARIDKSPFDWVKLAPSKTSLGLTVFSNWSHSRPIGLSAIATPSTAGTATSGLIGGQLAYSTYIKDNSLSSTRTGVSVATNQNARYIALPAARVLVSSDLDSANSAISTLAFAGASGAVGRSTKWTWESAHETQIFSEARGALHRLKVSADVRLDGYRNDVATNDLGTFAFNSLVDLAAGRPSSFSRAMSSPATSGAEWNGFVALGDQWRVSPNFQVQYGLRAEGNRFTSAPPYDAAIDEAFGRRTDVAPSGVHLSPRLGFSWTRAGGQNNGGIRVAPVGQFNLGPTGYLRGGIGDFRQMMPADLLAPAFGGAAGLFSGRSALYCIGAAVPTPNWTAFASDLQSIPTECAQGGGQPVAASQSTYLISPAFASPHSWRANLSYASTFHGISYSVDGTGSLNLNQPSLEELNLSPSVAFLATDEGRPIFSPTTAIAPATGLVSRSASRRTQTFDQVIQSGANGRSVTKQLIVTLSPDISRVSSWLLSGSYVLSATRERTNGFTNSTFGSPTDFSWTRGRFDSRHAFLGQAGFTKAGLTGSIFTRISSGTPFTPLVASDINGDGFANDRAFLFHDASTPNRQEVVSALDALIKRASGNVRACLTRQLGKPAAPNSCEGPWTATMNATVVASPDALHALRLGGRLTQIQLSFANPLSGVDYLLHGADRLRGWGLPAVPDPMLYNAVGFDPSTQRFDFAVNPRFGNTSPTQGLIRAPFRVTLDVSLNIGRDPGLQQLERYLRPGRGGHPGPRLPAAELKRRYERSVPDPYARILQESDSLLLSQAQAVALGDAQMRYRIRMDSLWTRLADEFAAFGDTFDAASALKRQESAIDEGWEIARLSIHAELPQILNHAQLAVLPGVALGLLRSDVPVRRNGRTLFP